MRSATNLVEARAVLRGVLMRLLKVPLRLRPGQAVVEVFGGTLSSRLPRLSVVALYRTALLPGTDGEVVAQEGIARLKVALPALADRCRWTERRQQHE